MSVGLNTLRDHAMVHTGAFHLLGKEHCYDAYKNDDDYQCWENDDGDDADNGDDGDDGDDGGE